jgi:hypothetical protein
MAKFYQSYDRLFIFKSLTSEEVERMHSFLKDYHPVNNNPRNATLKSNLIFECSVHCREARKNSAAPVPGHVPNDGGRSGTLLCCDEECF